jgi:tetratricopeptide (TPR) repeat protein
MPEETYQYDVFISYSHKDEPWAVETLLPALEDAGLKACIDFRDFTPGKPSRHNMRDACKESARTLLVMTPAWMASEWAAFEELLSFLHDPAGKHQRTIPILLEACDIPEDIQIFTYVDFQRTDRLAIAWKQLFTALGKPDARIPGGPPTAKSDDVTLPESWRLVHPYAMPENFTGRHAERNMLTGWLKNDPNHPLLIVCALGGFGKSALTWHWLTHDVDAQACPKALWWSFYEGDASFDNFLTATLTYLGLPNAERINPRQKTELLLNALQRPGLLLILDGFERELRAYASMGAAYQGDDTSPSPTGRGVRGEGGADGPDTSLDCVSPYADVFLRNIGALGSRLRSKVLMTTRLTPRAVESRGGLLQGCREEELRAMHAKDAVDFFHAQGIRGARVEIESACAAYGCHPLSLRILAGWVANDRQTPGDISAAARLDVTDDIIQNKHHILEMAFNSLNPAQQKLLGRIACFRAPVGYEALKSVQGSGKGNDVFDRSLEMLEKRGLLHWDRKANQYDLHPIVRRYAYDRLTSADRAAAHTRLADYFAAIPEREKVEKLDDLAPVIELYHHMVRAGKLDEAIVLFRDRLTNPLYFQLGGYQQVIELLVALFLDGENESPRLKAESAQAWTLNMLANAYALSGQPRRAVPLSEMHNDMREKTGDKQNLARGLGNVGQFQLVIGALAQAQRNLRRSVDLCREIENELWESIGRQELGRALSYRGAWPVAEQELEISFNYDTKGKDYQGLSVDLLYRALRCLLMARAEEKTKNENLTSAIEHAKRALELADMHGLGYPVERDYIRAHWLLGAAYRALGVSIALRPHAGFRQAQPTSSTTELTEAETHLGEALRRCRAINLVEVEADILLEVAKLRHAQGETPEALRLANEALLITERSGYVLQGADVHLFLAELAESREERKESSDAWGGRETALEHARQARALATCDGGEYVYKVAYDEAGAMIQRLALSQSKG